MLLSDTTHAFEFATSSAATIHWNSFWVETSDPPTTITPGSDQGTVSSATDTTLVPAPGAASTFRKLKFASWHNAGSTANEITVQKDVSGTEYPIVSIILQPGETLTFAETQGFNVLDESGRIRTVAIEPNGATGRTESFFKLGAGAAEAAGVKYLQSRDTGNPGTWAVGTSGIPGRATDGTAAGDAGCLPYSNATVGQNRLVHWFMEASSTGVGILVDVLWVNNGLVVTTLVAQAVNSVAFPARDSNGTVNGNGCKVGILVVTATTNAAAITTITMSYTNQAGTAGRTATMSSFPATCTAGSVIYFQLQAGDTGVQSIQSVTLGTSMVTGAISLIVIRELARVALRSAWIGGEVLLGKPGIPLYDGSCMLPMFIPTSATTFNTSGAATWEEL